MNRPAPALTHDWIWQAIDALASRKDLSASGLARLAGLDATAFNPSKRFTPEGRPRWPSTESIAKILEVTGTTLDEFADIMNRGPQADRAATPKKTRSTTPRSSAKPEAPSSPSRRPRRTRRSTSDLP